MLQRRIGRGSQRFRAYHARKKANVLPPRAKPLRVPRIDLDGETRRVARRATVGGSVAIDELDALLEQPRFFEKKLERFLQRLDAKKVRVEIRPMDSDDHLIRDAAPGPHGTAVADPVQYYFQEVARIHRLRKAGELRMAQRLEFLRARVMRALAVLQRRGVEAVAVDKDLPAGQSGLGLTLRGEALTEEKVRARRLVLPLEHLRSRLTEYKFVRDEFVERNLHLVVDAAMRYRHLGTMVWDLIQEGNLGLMRAVERYDWRKNLRFSTYASWWIDQAMVRGCLNNLRTIRVPIYVYKKLNEVRNRLLASGHAEGLSSEDAAEAWREANVPKEKVELFLSVDRFIYSLNQMLPEGKKELGDILEDDRAPDPSEQIERRLVIERIHHVLDVLTERERRILELRFGIGNPKTHTLEEVSQVFGISRERVRQLQKQALERLRGIAEGSGLEDPEGRERVLVGAGASPAA